jgi:hypothetical protein
MTTLVTAAQIAQLRRMVAEPTAATYSDAVLTTYIETYPHLDQWGESPLDAYGLANANWTATYDLHAAAADVWEEKAALVVDKFDFAANGGQYTQNQQYISRMSMCRFHRSRRLPSTATLVKSPEESTADESYIGNLPESD